MKIKKTKFKNLVILKGVKHQDKRGYLRELVLEKLIKKKFKFQILSVSKKNVLRGLHFQVRKPQGKLISVLKGEIFDVSVDLRKNSKTYGKYFSCILSEINAKSIYIPPGFAHGFCALDKENYIIYSCTKYRSANSEVGIKYNDEDLKINWPVKKPIISKKDNSNYSFVEFKKKFKNV